MYSKVALQSQAKDNLEAIMTFCSDVFLFAISSSPYPPELFACTLNKGTEVRPGDSPLNDTKPASPVRAACVPVRGCVRCSSALVR